jgi:arabinan endo-1,5-alpha-L-arabinosidase
MLVRLRPTAICLVVIAILVCPPARSGQESLDSPLLQPYTVQGDVEHVHDPSLIRAGVTYYLFSTDHKPTSYLTIRCSTDLETWKICGHVFDTIPQWIVAKFPKIRNLWAPDVSYFAGKYHVYYAASVFGKNTSVIGLATNVTLDPDSPDYRWVDCGPVIESTTADEYNTIDSNIWDDGKKGVWMTFGSFWTGIKQRKIDPGTGMLSTLDTTLHSLARRSPEESPHDAIEAPFLVRHGKYYYLFVSFDFCCRGAQSTYRVMVGRSSSVNGPFSDRSGVPMMKGGGTELLAGRGDWAGPGGQSVLLDSAGHGLIVFHAYSKKDGSPWLHVNSLRWKDGWPVIAP